MGLEQLFNSLIPMSALFGFIVILVVAMRSKSDGKALIETFKKKRFLGIEISQGALALSEGMMAAAITVELFDLPYGVRLTGHIALICTSVFAGFQIGDQIKEAKKAIDEGVDVVAECMDAFMSILLAILPPFANVAYIATSLKGYRDIAYFFTFQHDRIKSGMIMITCWIFVIHVLVVIYLATASTRKEKDEPGGVVVPLTQAPDSDDDGADTDDEEDTSTDAPNQDIIPYSRIPDRTNLLNYIKEHLGHRVDLERVKHKMMIDDLFLDRVAVSVEDTLKVRDKWDAEKSILQAAVVEVEKKKNMLKRARQSYNFDENSRVSRGLMSEIEHLEGQIVITGQLAEDAELVYNKQLNKLGDLLDIL